MRVFLTDGNLCICAEVEDGAVPMGIGPSPDKDERILAINWMAKTYSTTREYNIPFPEKWYVPEKLQWEVHRVGTTIQPGHRVHHM